MENNNKIRQPIFVSGCARSGTTLLFSLLSSSKEIWSSYREEHGVYEWDIGLHPSFSNDKGVSLNEADYNEERGNYIRHFLWQQCANSELFGVSYIRNDAVSKMGQYLSRKFKRLFYNQLRIVDKNPKHVYRIPFLDSVFPDSKYVFIIRDARSNISSLIEGWESRKYETYQSDTSENNTNRGGQWSFELPPGWKSQAQNSIEQRCAFQWLKANESILEIKDHISSDRFKVIKYEDLIENPLREIENLCHFLDIRVDKNLKLLCSSLPVINTLTLPDKTKWKRHLSELSEVSEMIKPLNEQLGYGWHE